MSEKCTENCGRNSASVPWYRIESRSRVLDEVEKYSFIALPGKGGHSGLMPSKSCPGEGSEESYSNGSKRAWSARGPSSDWLAMR